MKCPDCGGELSPVSGGPNRVRCVGVYRDGRMVRGGCGSDYVKLDDEMCTLAAHSLFNSMMMKAALEGVHSLSEPEPGEDPSEIHEVADDVLRLIEMEWEVA